MNLKPYLLDLLNAGFSQAEIARRIGVERSVVNYALTNEQWEPKYSVGIKLMLLHQSTRGNKEVVA